MKALLTKVRILVACCFEEKIGLFLEVLSTGDGKTSTQ